MVLWTIRAAAVCYGIAVFQMIRRREARAAWSAGCAFYVAHVVTAFYSAYGWSHSVAVRETARQTRELFGLDWGGGIWFNYAFTVVWVGDVIWWWLAPGARRVRPGWVDTAMHVFMAWMFVNGAVVFPSGAVRWVSAVAAAGLFLYWLAARRRVMAR